MWLLCCTWHRVSQHVLAGWVQCNSLAVRSLSSQQYAALAEANANDVALYEATVFLLNQRKAACDAAV